MRYLKWLLPLFLLAQPANSQIQVNGLPHGSLNGAYWTICDTGSATYICTFNQVSSWLSTNLTGLQLSTAVTGTLPIANGGTGQTTASAALNALLPSQGSASGDCLGTNGTNSSWVTCGSGGGGGVSTVSVVSANGFAGTVATATTTPAITLNTSISGPIKGNGTALSAAAAADIYGLWSGT